LTHVYTLQAKVAAKPIVESNANSEQLEGAVKGAEKGVAYQINQSDAKVRVRAC